MCLKDKDITYETDETDAYRYYTFSAESQEDCYGHYYEARISIDEENEDYAVGTICSLTCNNMVD